MPVRFEMMRHFGAFVTESSPPHVANMSPISAAPTGDAGATAWDAARTWTATSRARRSTTSESGDRLAATEPIPTDRTHEYCSYIIHAIETNTPFRMNANVPNTGLITNLPDGCCVEVPCLVDNAGIHPCHVGELPPQLAGLNRTNINVQELAVKAALEGDREAVYQAVALDPLTAAVLTLDEVAADGGRIVRGVRAVVAEGVGWGEVAAHPTTAVGK